MRSVLALSALCATAFAHMEMSNPYPFKSKFDPENADGDIDYSMTNPLEQDGSNFPCKGYHKDSEFRPTAEYSIGQSYSIDLEGSALHDGGSCQISLSFDNGATFKVVHSMMGGCPIAKHYDFSIPAEVPSGEALLAWSWFNLTGNREMYMNCAAVTISGGAKTADAFNALPDMWAANVGNDCKTVEGKETVFANPGASVEYGGDVTPDSPPAPDC